MKILEAVRKVCVPSWAKINLFLAVTGKRKDGFHDLVSVLAKIQLHDLVSLERTNKNGEVSCFCSGAENLNGRQNLASKAVDLWREETGLDFGVRIEITKRIPQEAGLGGGSSNAVATLQALNRFMEGSLGDETLLKLCAQLGSDCPSFLSDGFCLAQGRGELVEEIESPFTQGFRGREIFLFKPPIGFPTAEIYSDLASDEENYCSKKQASQHIDSWLKGEISLECFLSNTLDQPVFKKHRYFVPLFNELADDFGLRPMISGSGSCCFCIVGGQVPWQVFQSRIRRAWGDEAITFKSYIR